MGSSLQKPKYQIIFDDLRESIRRGDFKANDQIPSERALAETYQVTRTTARRALLDLEQVGLVRRDGARGTRVLPGRGGRRAETLTVVCSAETVASIDEFLRQSMALAERRGWGFRALRLNPGEEKPLLRSLAPGNLHVVLAERLELEPDSRLGQILSQNANRVVVVGNDLSSVGVRSVICSDQKGMTLAMNYLHTRGHRFVGLVCGREDLSHPVLRGMIDFWRTQMLEVMDPREADRHLIRMEDRSFESLTMEAYDVVRDYLRRVKSKSITALICLKEELAIGTVAACRDVGRPVPESISVIEYGRTPRARIAATPRTGIDVHMEKHVKAAFEFLAPSRKPSETSPLLRRITPTLVEGETVAVLSGPG